MIEQIPLCEAAKKLDIGRDDLIEAMKFFINTNVPYEVDYYKTITKCTKRLANAN